MGMKARPLRYCVDVIEIATGDVIVKGDPVDSERLAEKIKRGYDINLDHARCIARIVETRRQKA